LRDKEIDRIAGKYPPGMRWRVGDTERDVIIGRLNKALLDGELSPDENLERVSQAMRARYISDLELLIEDLPAPPPTELDRFRAWLGRQETNTDFWLAGIPAGLVVGIVPACYIAANPHAIGAFKSAFIALAAIAGLYIFMMSVVLAVRAHDTKNRRKGG